MSLSIKEKLRFLDRPQPSSQPARKAFQPTVTNAERLMPDSQIVENEYGTCLLREKQYPLSFLHGNSRLGEFADLPEKLFTFIANDLNLGQVDKKGIIFLDTETTGLAGGAGTLIFLIALGYFEDDVFTVKQFILLDPGEERAFLEEIQKCLQHKSCFVTYNGKSYDIPLLKSRFILNRIRPKFEQFSHIDLLHHCRRLWKKSAPSCSLATIEAHVLGFQRQHDIPSSQIPETYFQFLKSRDLELLIPILKHNVQDILSLVSIILNSYHIFFGELESKADMAGVVRILSNLNEYENAIQIEAPLVQNEKDMDHQEFLIEKANVYKRLKNYPKALEIWKQIRQNRHFNEDSYIEAAKILEHKIRDYKSALEIIEKIENRFNTLAELRPHLRYELNDDINKRKHRLMKKIENRQKTCDPKAQ